VVVGGGVAVGVVVHGVDVFLCRFPNVDRTVSDRMTG